MQNLYQLIKYSLMKKPELDTFYERRHPACEYDTADS